jgi:hypothetical protein
LIFILSILSSKIQEPHPLFFLAFADTKVILFFEMQIFLKKS